MTAVALFRFLDCHVRHFRNRVSHLSMGCAHKDIHLVTLKREKKYKKYKREVYRKRKREREWENIVKERSRKDDFWYFLPLPLAKQVLSVTKGRRDGGKEGRRQGGVRWMRGKPQEALTHGQRGNPPRSTVPAPAININRAHTGCLQWHYRSGRVKKDQRIEHFVRYVQETPSLHSRKPGKRR